MLIKKKTQKLKKIKPQLMSSLAKGREGDDDQESMGRREDDRGLEADNEAMDVVNVGELEVDHV